MTHTQKQVKIHKIKKESTMLKAYFQKCAIKWIGEAHLCANTWAKHHRRRGPGPATSPLARGDGQASLLGCGCGRTPGGMVRAQSPLAVYGSVWRWFTEVSIFTRAKPSWIHYKRRARVLSTTHNIWNITSHRTCTLFIALVVVVESKAKLARRACLLGSIATWYEYYYEEFFQVHALIFIV
jgi:hypothetical protein